MQNECKGLTVEVEELVSQMELERSDFDKMLNSEKIQYEEIIADLKKELNSVVVDVKNYKTQSELLEKDLEKEKNFADSTKKRLD